MIICMIFIALLVIFITYEEQHNKGHIYRTISHICHNKIVCALGNFVACDLAVVRVNNFVMSRNNMHIPLPLKRC